MSKNSKKDLEAKLLEAGYTIEVLEDEIGDLEEVIRIKQERIVELINENDRLTITYEPYRPEGDEDFDKDFYGLIEENKDLLNSIYHLSEANKKLNGENADLSQRLKSKCQKHRKNGVISFDFWPLNEWVRFSRKKWNPGMAAQICVGPVRVDWFAD